MALLRARNLDENDSQQEIQAIIDRDPVTHAFIESRLTSWLNGSARLQDLHGQVWVVDGGSEIEALCYSGANLVPSLASDAALDAITLRAFREGRTASSIVGPAHSVLSLWAGLESRWGPPREVRSNQPLLVIESAPKVLPDPLVKMVEPVELSILFPACVAMFTEEIGISPLEHDGGIAYRSRLAEMIIQGRSFARIESGEVVFKAELGLLTSRVSQIQGVWTKPELRGAGIGTAGSAAVVQFALTRAPMASLYVNHFNASALRVYEKVGFLPHTKMASILF